MIKKDENQKELKDFLNSTSDLDGNYKESFSNCDENLKLNKEDVIKALKTVYDPEIPVNIYDLGLIYEIELIDEYIVKINMTLTTPNCPVAGEMPSMVANSIKNLNGFKSVEINLVWEPPWTKDMMTEDAKLALDID
ncbi:MAG: hypothetical protein CFH22_01320 [Alphaproteobacteria bacterium MarineAlpha5_Bin12]|nr:SUF system Fe-S cluster assembly protein [Pelagibacteraceae bacterium]PPR40661.1 MAG: hypothetical protein CFH22_01320 [Alphaproteobacteria bacterium MarineAlpha5_Bin12]|tara:strand:- start:6444 stop:6854 length:411 start_codon:yes stop_codon:yes gene_type:complete